jgi:hypothetical protein
MNTGCAIRAKRSSSSSSSSFRGQQQRLADSIARMADSIASGRCRPPNRAALQRIADLCDEWYLDPEAARVRRWMAP